MDQVDTNGSDVENTNHVRSRRSSTKGPNPQVNWRVEEEIKREIEEQAQRRGVGAGEIIKELWRGQHAETIALLQGIMLAVDEIPSRLSTSIKVAAPVEPAGLLFDYLTEEPTVLETPQSLPVTTPKFGWVRRLLCQ